MLVHSARTSTTKRDTDAWLESEGGPGLALALAGCRKFWADDEDSNDQGPKTGENASDAQGLSGGRLRTLIVIPPKWREVAVLALGETRLPRLDFRCSVILTSCPKLERVDEGYTVNGDLTIEHCNELVELPPNLAVYGSLTILRCAKFARLGPGTFVSGDCRIQGCKAFQHLPSEFRIGGNLELNMLDELETLPRDLAIGGRAIFSYGPTLALRTDEEILARTAPDRVKSEMVRKLQVPTHRRAVVAGSLRALGCKRLELGENSWVGGSLCVASEGGPTGLLGSSTIPSPRLLPFSRLFVGGNLYLEGLTGAAELSENLNVRGEFVELRSCWGVSHLPSSLFDVRSATKPLYIRLIGTGLRGGALDVVRTMQVPHVNVEISGAQLEELAAAAQQSSKQLAEQELAEHIRNWHPTLHLEVDPAYQRGLQLFLTKLRSSKEYTNEVLRVGLVRRVREALELLAQEDLSTRAELLSRVCDSVDSCGDKPIWALNQICALAAIIKARRDADALREVGRAIMRLGIVHDFAMRKVTALGPSVDEVCVFLRYEVDLRERLALPVSAVEMLYPHYVNIGSEDLEAAARAVEAATESSFQQWLSAWDEWRRFLRWQQVVPYDQLQCADASFRFSGAWSRAVVLRGEECGYDEVAEYWERTGLDLFTNSRVDAQTLFCGLLRAPGPSESSRLQLEGGIIMAEDAAEQRDIDAAESASFARHRAETVGGGRRRNALYRLWASICSILPSRNSKALLV